MSSVIDSLIDEYADLVALGRDGQVVLVVHVHPRKREAPIVSDGIRTLPFFVFRDANRWIAKDNAITPFGMLVFLDYIDIYHHGIVDEGNPPERSSTLGMTIHPSLNTAEILSEYNPDFANKEIYHTYLTTLTDVWLMDLAYHWKSEKPPGSDELAAIGLLPLLEGGTTRTAGSVG